MNIISNLHGLDGLSIKILKALQANARMSITEIGKRVGLSGPAVSERIKKMEDEGIINGYTTNINHDKIGMAINAFITLKSGLTHGAIVKKMNEIPEILECYNITGNYCMIMKVTVQLQKGWSMLSACLPNWAKPIHR